MTNIESNYLAHSANQYSTTDPLKVHLQDVANRASEYAATFGASKEAYTAGLLHDLGKYGDLFRKRLEGKASGIDHWSAGAWEALNKYQQQGIAITLAIQGHHIGLQQSSVDAIKGLNPQKLQEYHSLGLQLSNPNTKELLQRLDSEGLKLPAGYQSVYPGLKEAFEQKQTASAMLDVRMLFSTLVDADFIETEAHFQGNPDGSKNYRETGASLKAQQTLLHLQSYLKELASRSEATSHVNQLRTDLLQACLEAGRLAQGIYTLTAPTGTGKTFSMLSFALEHAMKHELERIIMVIPYLSIIEQTVSEYRKAFKSCPGSESMQFILENHSLAGTRSNDEDDKGREIDMENESRRMT
ncbi:MAG: CRISPR-associated endonuclease Cas3'', partial [Dehalococcoidia bacterium]